MLAGRSGIAAVGLLDFQDAVRGPCCFDLVSLIDDARRDVSRELGARLLERYLAAFPELDRAGFDAAYALSGAQRDTRILGNFARLLKRDGKPGYLVHMPRVWRQLEAQLAHPALAPVAALVRPLSAAGTPAHAGGRMTIAPHDVIPKTAMVLAAGLATRLRPLSLERPKALMEVAGKTLLDHALDRLAEVGVERAVVNTHHLAAQIERHLAGRKHPAITISHEPEILDSGGGIAKALPLLGPEAFYVINAKIVWRGGRSEALNRLAEVWDDARMDGLLLLHPTVSAVGYEGAGRFHHGSARPDRLPRSAGGGALRLCQHPDPASALLRRCADRGFLAASALASAPSRPAASTACAMTASGITSPRRRGCGRGARPPRNSPRIEVA